MTDYKPLGPWAPSPGEHARAIELFHDGIADPSQTFELTFLHACTEAVREMRVPQLLLAAMNYAAVSLLHTQGRELTLARMTEDLAVARGEAAEEAAWNPSST